MLFEIISRLFRGEKGDDLPILVSDLGIDYDWAAQKIFEDHHGEVIAKIIGGIVSVIGGFRDGLEKLAAIRGVALPDNSSSSGRQRY